jgi:nucleotide-binding universal stress UspA family protein
VRQPPDPETLTVRSVLLASESREIPSAAVELAARIAGKSAAAVHVVTIARVHGTAFGLPNPGLLPTKAEWEQQRAVVKKAVARLRRKGLEADGFVYGTRGGAKRIAKEAKRLGCDAIVMAADPPRNRLLADFMWSQEPYRVRRHADVPVYLVVDS